MPLHIVHSAQTDIGLKRAHNEDRYVAAPSLGLFVVCDGMGGGNAGEIASAMATDAIRTHIEAAVQYGDVDSGWSDPGFSAMTHRLAEAARFANQVVFDAARSHKGYAGMGTTVAAAYLSGDTLSLVHVGDSRVYLVRNYQIQALTADHSWVAEQVRNGSMTEEEAAQSPRRNIVTRALGVDPMVEVECQEIPVFHGDTLLICSDGLTRGVDGAEILRTIQDSADMQQASRQLIAMANAAGGEDNTTVLLLKVEAHVQAGTWQRLREWFRAA